MIVCKVVYKNKLFIVYTRHYKQNKNNVNTSATDDRLQAIPSSSVRFLHCKSLYIYFILVCINYVLWSTLMRAILSRQSFWHFTTGGDLCFYCLSSTLLRKCWSKYMKIRILLLLILKQRFWLSNHTNILAKICVWECMYLYVCM